MIDFNTMKLGVLIRTYRASQDMTLKELGAAIGMAFTHLSELEREEKGRNLSLSQALRLSKLFGIPLEQLAEAAERSKGGTHDQT